MRDLKKEKWMQQLNSSSFVTSEGADTKHSIDGLKL